MEIEIGLEKNSKISNLQEKFLETTLGKVINKGIDVGLKSILPNFLEDQIIEIKDAILENGFKEGLNQAIKSAIDIGKSTIGIVTGEFENVGQIKNAVKNGGIIDSVSKLLDKAINFAENKKIINSSTSILIKNGKDTILEQVTTNVENNLTNQIGAIEKINKYCNNWNEYFNKKDFDGMQKEYNKIKQQNKNIIPIRNTVKELEIIENLHQLIKNNGKNFELSEEELELARRLN